MRWIKHKDNIFSRFLKLAEPHKGYFVGQTIPFIIYTVLLSVMTLFAARTINYMYLGEWSKAYLFLGLELATIVVRNIALHIQYKYYAKQCGHIRSTVSRKIYNKILSAGDAEADELSKEKIINIATNNMGNMADFPDNVSSFIAYSVQVIFTLVIVFTSNWLAGLIVIGLGVINAIAYITFNKKLGRLMLQRYEKKDDMFKSYSKIIDGKDVINEYSGKDKYEHELIDNVQGFNKAYSKYWNMYSWKNDLYYAIWNTAVYAITALMLYYVSSGTMDMAVYLVIVPYLTSCTDKLCSLFDKSSNVENMRVDVDRINTILSLNDEELIEYGQMNAVSDGYDLKLINVTEGAKPDQKYPLHNVYMSFTQGGINIVKGPKDNGKRVIFDLLRRYEYPDDGKILLDNLNLYDYNEKTFKSHISYCSSHPMFIKGSVEENLSLVCKDKDRIKDILTKLDIMGAVNNLPQGISTNALDIEDSTLLYMLGLARALLTNCKILMIYEIPSDAPSSFRNKISSLISKYQIDKTLIFFTHSDMYDTYADTVYSVVEGKVSKIK